MSLKKIKSAFFSRKWGAELRDNFIWKGKHTEKHLPEGESNLHLLNPAAKVRKRGFDSHSGRHFFSVFIFPNTFFITSYTTLKEVFPKLKEPLVLNSFTSNFFVLYLENNLKRRKKNSRKQFFILFFFHFVAGKHQKNYKIHLNKKTSQFVREQNGHFTF